MNDNEIVHLPDTTYINYSFDIPELAIYDMSGYITLENLVYYNNTVWFNVEGLVPMSHHGESLNLHDGYLTVTDNGTNIDQQDMQLVRPEWIIGKVVKVNDIP